MMFQTPCVLAALIILSATYPAPALGDDLLPFDVLSYELSVRIDFENSPDPGVSYRHLFSPINTLRGEATIKLRNNTERALYEIPLILNRLMKPSAIELDGAPQPFHGELRGLQDRETLQVLYVPVALPASLVPGGELELTVLYDGQLVGYPESGMLYTQETLDPEFTILRSETFCYPTIALPTRDSTSRSARSDAFDQSLKITVPKGHIAVNGGKVVDVVEAEGRTTFSYASHSPDSAILIAIAPYGELSVGSHRIFHFAESSEGAANLSALLGKALELLSSWLGPPPLDRGLVIAEIPEYFGSQAGALIIQTSAAFRSPDRYGEFYHELSHIWNPRDVDPKPCRWNEGLATFLQAMVEEQLSENATLDASLEQDFSRLRGRLQKDPSLGEVAMIDYGKNEMTDVSYTTGALLFGLLRNEVGEEQLLQFLGQYSRDHREGGTRDAEFAAAVRARLGAGAAAVMEDWFLTAGFAESVLAAESWGELLESYRAPR